MKITQFAKNIKPLSKADALKNINETKMFVETISDSFREAKAAGIHMDTIFSATGQQRLAQDISKSLPGVLSLENIMMGCINGADSIIKEAIAIIQASKQNLMSGETMTIRQANALMCVSAIDLWVDYTNRLLNYGMMRQMKSGKNKAIKRPDQDFFTSAGPSYVDITKMLFESFGIIIKRLKAMPEVPVDEQTVDVLESTKGVDAVLAMPVRGLGIHNFNPIYYYKSVKMEIDLARIRSHNERIDMNAALIQQLQDEMIGNPNAARESVISKLEDRIIKSQATIQRIQESYDYNE